MGTERVISYLTEELLGLGHEVTLFVSGDLETNAKLVPACPRTEGRQLGFLGESRVNVLALNLALDAQR